MRPTLRWLGVILFFAGLTALHTWPLARDVVTHMQPGSDPKTMMWAQHDLARNLASDPLHLMNGSAFYPHSGTLAVVDHQLGNALLAVPLVSVGLSVVGTFNVVFMATFFLSGLFMCILVYRLTGSLLAGLFSGCAFAFSAARIYNLPHSHVLATQWVPLGLLGVHAYLERPTVRRWLGLLAGALLVAASSWHIMIIGGIAMAVVAVWLLAAGERDSRRLGGLALAALLCACALLPLVSSYVEIGRRWPPVREGTMPVENIVKSSVDVPTGLIGLPKESRAPYAALLSTNLPAIFPGIVTLLFALPAFLGLRKLGRRRALPASLGWGQRVAAALLGLTLAAAWAGPTMTPLLSVLRPLAPWVLCALAVAAASLWRAATATPQESASPSVSSRTIAMRAYAALAVSGALLALGPRVMAGAVDLGSGLWRLDLLPVPLLMRAPARFSLLLALGLAVLGGFVIAGWQKSLRWRQATLMVGLALVALNIDLAFAMPELAAVPPPTGADRWLAEEAGEGAVIEFPLHGNYWAIHASQQYYDRRNVDGRGFLRPPAVRRLRAREDLTRLQMDLLWEYSRPRYVVVREEFYSVAELARVRRRIDDLGDALELRIRDGDDVVYELFDRGRGTRIFRRWPHTALEGRLNSVVLTGALSGGSQGKPGRLLVLMNGRRIGEFSEQDLLLRSTQRFGFDATDIIAGENTMEIRADYLFAPGEAPNRVGTSGAELAADVTVSASLAANVIEINGVRTRREAPCWLVLLDSATGDAVNEYSGACLDGEATGEIEEFVATVPEGGVVAVAVAIGSPANAETVSRMMTAISELGLGSTANDASFVVAGVAVKGAAVGSVLESRGAATATVTVGSMDRRRFAIDSLRVR